MTEPITFPTLATPSNQRGRREVDQCLVNRIAAAHLVIQAVLSDAGLQALVEPLGYGPARLQEGLRLYRTAQAAFIARQAAMGGLRVAVQASERAEASARRIYAEFRAVARLLFTDGITRINLALEGRLPDDLDKFLLVSRSVYNQVERTPAYRSRMTQYGSLPAVRSALDGLQAAHTARLAAEDAALRATHKWDQTMIALDKWVGLFCKTAHPVLAGRPEIAHLF